MIRSQGVGGLEEETGHSKLQKGTRYSVEGAEFQVWKSISLGTNGDKVSTLRKCELGISRGREIKRHLESMGRDQMLGKKKFQRECCGPALLGLLLAATGLLTGCSFVSTLSQNFLMSDDEFQNAYGVVTVSEPVVFTHDEVEKAVDLSYEAIKFDAALLDVAKAQSEAARFNALQSGFGLGANLDLQQLAALAAAAQAGAPPPALPPGPAGSTVPGKPSLVAPNADFQKLALAASSTSLSTPLSRRIQTASNDVLLNRFSAATQKLVGQMKDDHDVYFVFSTLTVLPGELTRFNSEADIRLAFFAEGPKSGAVQVAETSKAGMLMGLNRSDVKVFPIFPTFDSVGELNQAVSTFEFQSFLNIVATLGASAVNPQMQAAVQDIRRLSSAHQRATLIGSPTNADSVAYRIRGLRTARPFDEWRARGTYLMEPLTLPLLSVVAVKKASGASAKNLGFMYSSRWQRYRPWWDLLPPGTLFRGFWYNRGTAFKNPEKIEARQAREPGVVGRTWRWGKSVLQNDANDSRFFRDTARAGIHYAVVAPKAKEKDEVETVEAVDTIVLVKHPFAQSLVVRTKGPVPAKWYLAGVPVTATEVGKAKDGTGAGDKVVKERTFEIPVAETLLRGLRKAGACYLLRAYPKNSSKPTTILVGLAFDVEKFPVPESLRLEVTGSTGIQSRTLLREPGVEWPNGAFGAVGSVQVPSKDKEEEPKPPKDTTPKSGGQGNPPSSQPASQPVRPPAGEGTQ